MNENKARIARDNHRALGVFIGVIVVAAIFGGFLGGAGNFLGEGRAWELLTAIYNQFIFIAPFLSVPMVLVAWIVTGVLYLQARKLYRSWEEDNEEQMKVIELKLSYALALSSVIMIIGYFLFPIGLLGLDTLDPYNILTAVGILMALFGLIFTIIYVTYFQKKIIDMEREMNPEKQGSVFEFKFQDKWEASCDEAEKLMIYKSAYQAYKTTSYWCMGLWLFCVIGIFSFHFGIMPLTMVSVIWLVMTVSYNRKAINLSK